MSLHFSILLGPVWETCQGNFMWKKNQTKVLASGSLESRRRGAVHGDDSLWHHNMTNPLTRAWAMHWVNGEEWLIQPAMAWLKCDAFFLIRLFHAILSKKIMTLLSTPNQSMRIFFLLLEKRSGKIALGYRLWSYFFKKEVKNYHLKWNWVYNCLLAQINSSCWNVLPLLTVSKSLPSAARTSRA